MYRLLKSLTRIITIAVAFVLANMIATALSGIAPSSAEVIIGEPTATATPQIIDLRPVITPTPEPIPYVKVEKEIEITEHKLDEDDVEILAKLLWSSPLRCKDCKEKLVWVVMNRVYDKSGTFDDTIKKCVNKSEFGFYDSHAHISEKNLEIVRNTLNKYLSLKDGKEVGNHFPTKALYIRFVGESNSAIELLAEKGGEAIG